MKKLVKGFASVILASMIFIVGCKPPIVADNGTITITVKGDERIDLRQTIEKPRGAKWSDIKAEIEDIKKNIKATAAWKVDWEKGDYAFYEWRVGDENGKKIHDDYTFSDNTTVYAVSNYKKWKIEDDGSGNKVLSGVEGSKPRGKIILPAGVTSIGKNAFYLCSGLTGITIPDGVTAIGDYAFFLCSALTGITIQDSVTTIGVGAFQNCSALTAITIPNSVTSIGEGAFQNCSALTAITIPSSVTTIGEGAFEKCSALTTITIPSSVTTIGKGAFYNCSALTGITIPDSVTTIGVGAFYGCSALTDITIPNSVTSIGDGAFGYCENLTLLSVDSGNTVYKSDNNIIYTKDGKSLIVVAGGLSGTIDIPAGVTVIGDSAFAGCSALSGITIPSSVTTIGISAFYGCSALTGITIPNSVSAIGYSAFANCYELTSISFADPKGWVVYQDSKYTIKKANIEESKLAGPNSTDEEKKATADLLCYSYGFDNWKKN